MIILHEAVQRNVDDRTTVVLVGMVLTLAFVAVILAVLEQQANRRGVSVFRNRGATGWYVAFLVVFAGVLFSSAIEIALIIPYNVPLDWTPFYVFAPIYIGLGLASVEGARRLLVRRTGRPTTAG